jgi:hypothetical protein
VQVESARLAEVEARIAYIEKEGCVPRYEAESRTSRAARALSLSKVALDAHFETPHMATFRRGLQGLRLIKRVARSYTVAQEGDPLRR